VELRSFADSVGFEGDESDWVDWYRDTCAEVGANRKLGVDRAQFMMLTQDADNEDLFRLCGKRRPQAAMRHAMTLRTVFDVFDRDHDGYLNSTELRRFMDNLDFEGDMDEWGEKYVSICKDVGAKVELGVDRAQFGLVAERNATDAELDMLLQELGALTDATIAVDVWSKLQPKANGKKRLEPEPVEDEKSGHVLVEIVQSREPPPPQHSDEGLPLAPDNAAQGMDRSSVRSSIALKMDRSSVRAARLDEEEFELDNLRKQLSNQKAPLPGPRLQPLTPKRMPSS